MDKKRLEEAYSELLADVELDKLGFLLKQPNIFSALKVTHYEIRHSNFLGWLLNPSATHGLGSIFLNRFLLDIFFDSRAEDISIIDIPNLNLDKAIIKREWNNIDIAIEIKDVIIIIENKIESSEHSDQLKKYKQTAKIHYPNHKQVFVFLSPSGIEASDRNLYINYSYERVVEILEAIVDLYSQSLNHLTTIYIKDYITSLKLHVMENGVANQLARKIYKNHKELLDFIIENIPDHNSEFRKYFEQKITDKGWKLGSVNKGYVRFLTPALDEIISRGVNSNGWPNKEGFLFEIDYLWMKGKVRFYCTVPPGLEESADVLLPVLIDLENTKRELGKKWRTFFWEHENFDLDKLAFAEEEEILAAINKFWPKLENMVYKVEGAILTKREELLAIKNKLTHV